jgi:putative membrane protein
MPPHVHRLHPMTLVQRLLVSLPALVFLLVPLGRSPGRDAWFTLLVSVVYGVLTLPWIVLYYARFRYWLTPRELVIESGVFTRKHRSIPIERIENIQIEQRLLSRLLGTARVSVQTAGSTETEGVLDSVSLAEAVRIREAVRAFQRQQAALPLPAEEDVDEVVAPQQAPAAARTLLFTMPLSQVLQSGMYRFSLVYIAVIFSLLQYLEPNPTALIDLFLQEPLADQAAASPWLTGTLAVLLATLLGWLTGILINLNAFYGFHLWLEADKLHKRHGLLTVSEQTIPLKKVQALVLRTNPLMQHFGWYRLELQMMGLDEEASGNEVVIPFARIETLLERAMQFYPFTPPERWARVSPLHGRRQFVRSLVLLLLVVLPAAWFWHPALWGLLLVPGLGTLAWLQYRHHRYALEDDRLFIRRGFFRRATWMIPLEKLQVLYLTDTLFQRRLGLKTLYADTAGAGALAWPEVRDLPADTADTLFQILYERFIRRA